MSHKNAVSFSQQALMLLPFEQGFSQYLDRVSAKLDHMDETGEQDESIFTDLNFTPRYCQSLLDLSYEGGMNALFSEFERLDDNALDTILGCFILQNLAPMEKISEEAAFTIRYTIGQDLMHLDDDHIISVFYANTKHILTMREEEGWNDVQLDELKQQMTTVHPHDMPRLKHAKKMMRKELFPEEFPTERKRTYSPNKDVHLMEYGGEIDMEDLTLLPITSLYYDTLDRILLRPDGSANESVDPEDFIHLGKAMQAMYEIDSGFTLDFLAQKLYSGFHPRNENYVAYIIADFLHQRSTAEYENGKMDDLYYNHVMTVADAFLEATDDATRRNAALTNLQGMIEHHKEQNETIRIIKEQGKYFTAYKRDSEAQIEAKQIIAENVVTSKPADNAPKP